ncbi:MAG: glycine dehydrogenase, partial [Actinomycetes bacterium]
MSKPRTRFVDRHIGPDDAQVSFMLRELGSQSLESFISQVVPESIAMAKTLDEFLPAAISEEGAIAELLLLAKKNQVTRSLIGMGYYGTITPPVVLRNVFENPAWYTAYTPYQPEISQGRLEAIFAFQTAVSDLTGLPISNASMLDEATAAGEAMTLARRQWSGADDSIFVIDKNLHPHIKAVIHTRAAPLKLSVIESDIDANSLASIKEAVFGIIGSAHSTYGLAQDLSAVIEFARVKGALSIVTSDLLALTLYKTPGEWGADIAIGSAQRFGVPMGFGGPHAGFMSVRNGLERGIPGRLVGQSIDSHGNPGFRLALQTREQHIRRDKATSNICTAQVLLAVMSAFYAMWHGPDGLINIATRVRSQANSLRATIKKAGFTVTEGEIFDTFVVDTKPLATPGFNFRLISDQQIAISIDETVTQEELETIASFFGATLG